MIRRRKPIQRTRIKPKPKRDPMPERMETATIFANR